MSVLHLSQLRPIGLGLGVACALSLLAAPASANGGGGPDRSDLPFARGLSFGDLDAYLAHLQTLGTMGIPWYQALPDGRYVLVRRRPPGETPEVFTRQQLLDRFGFDE
jgi:hypothetical protein